MNERVEKIKKIMKTAVLLTGAASAFAAGAAYSRSQRRWIEDEHEPNGPYEKYVKEPLDAALATTALITLSPLMAFSGAAIKLSSEGPIFFKQDRIGKDQKIFEIYKYRTMVQNAEKMDGGVKVSGEDDPRITGIGKILRKYSLDELPQLINIIKGDMAIIGPRPPVTYHPYKIGEYDDEKKHRFDVLPGLTGLAQAEIRNMAPWDERIKYDLKYVDRISFLGDVKIIVDTVKTVVGSKGLYLG